MTVKKQEIPAYDPRSIQGIGLEYATCNRGGCHVKGYTIAVRGARSRKPNLDPRVITAKAFWVKLFQDVTAAVDAVRRLHLRHVRHGRRRLCRDAQRADRHATIQSKAFIQAGERIWNLERLFNLKAGLTKKDDTLPERLLNMPVPEGPAKGMVSRLPEMLPEYYQLRGWDENGIPTEQRLKELQLESELVGA